MATAKNSNEITSERELQVAIYDDPSILDGAWPEGDLPRWVFIRREMDTSVDSIPEHNLLLDFLLVDAEARPTLVETKLSSSTETRRTIVGQLLEYAAHAKGWDIRDLQFDYENAVDTRLRVLSEIPSPEIYASADDFWRRLRENLENNHMTLVFLADDFPQETKITAEFLDTVTKDNLSVRIYAPNGINLSSERPRGPARRRPTTRLVHPTAAGTFSAKEPSVDTAPIADQDSPLWKWAMCIRQACPMNDGSGKAYWPNAIAGAGKSPGSDAYEAAALTQISDAGGILRIKLPSSQKNLDAWQGHAVLTDDRSSFDAFVDGVGDVRAVAYETTRVKIDPQIAALLPKHISDSAERE